MIVKSLFSSPLPTTLVFILGLAILCASIACTKLNTENSRENSEGSSTPVDNRNGPSKHIEVDFKEIHISQVAVHTAKPSQIQIVFSLRDENNHALADITDDMFKDAFRITENNDELDYAETAYFVNTSASFALEVVFVLDFTASMDKAKVDEGTNGIDAMVDTFISSLKEIPEAHRVGVLEFHDKNMKPQILSRLTTDRTFIENQVESFSEDTESRYIPGFSRVWDSIPIAVSLFSQKSHTTRAIVVITDGHDTSSDISREEAFDIISEQNNKIQTYVMGVGKVHEKNVLERLALGTGGVYYPAAELSSLPEQLEIIVNDLRGQYKLSFITGRRTGKVKFGLELTLRNSQGKSVTGKWTSQEVDVEPINDKGTIGRITADPPSIDEENNTATMFIRALHIPREIRSIRFKLGTEKNIPIEVVKKEQGGLLEEWVLSDVDEAGFYTASGEQALAYGSFGLLFQLKIPDAAAIGFEIPIEFDNKIYTPQGKGIGECGEMRCLVYEPPEGMAYSVYWPEDSSRLGWYIESINNSPTNEAKLREAISLLVDEARINPELFYFPNWPSLDKASQSFDPRKAGRLLAEMGDFRPWGDREFGDLCVVSLPMKSEKQGRLVEIGSNIAAGLKAEADLDVALNGSSCTAGRIIITAPRN